MITHISVQILEGNLEADGTDELDVGEYLSMLNDALAVAFPDAEVDVDFQARCSGAHRHAEAVSDGEGPPMETSRAEDEAEEISNRIWMEWCERGPPPKVAKEFEPTRQHQPHNGALP